MLLLADPAASLDPTLIVGLVIFVALVAMGGLLVHLAARLKQQSEALAPLARLEAIESLLRQVAASEEDLDLRRLEHVLIDIRDGQKRVEERLSRVLEAPPTRSGDEPALDLPRPAGLAERVTGRLVAMGFERIEILSSHEELEALAAAPEGEVLVEARRSGASHKGRVLIKDGAICDVRIRDSYEAFP